jgi:capsular polysaccharide biosynthesis protein
MKCPIGDQQAEITRLKKKSDHFATRINSNAITRAEAKLAYEVFYIPALRYSLNITAINQIDMETIQSKATLAFLSAQGYNCHMPREVVYAPSLYQGIGMRHLYDIQGSDST